MSIEDLEELFISQMLTIDIICFSALLSMGFVKINSSSPVCLSLRVLCCPILLAIGFEKSVFRVLKKKKKKN
jgi:hypothetical protein